ncbi:MAG: glycosyltransferase family 2 protein [Cyclobacteriaceae bacterium]|jgi:cellulose synthase/poly-beta-1,6-N-acetylglucosamine synthase-like glycosyltransferase|nr:glycosyltransferase family 2 protein [Cyclobacteriaceae bacterium]
MVWALVMVYGLALLFLFLFSLGQLHLTWLYRKASVGEFKPPPSPWQHLPEVTVQLPIYNEKYVVERLIRAVAAFDYPADKLEIQILDDSTDETTDIIARTIESLRHKNLDIKCLHRQAREGFKAGALDYGFRCARGEFIAIFDADFVPPPDFLQRTLPYFAHARIGVVQTRWEHLNREYSWLTQLQAFGLDAHFSVEQRGRWAAGSFINFNGTCGIWRKQAIEEAGGWQADTLTEDLDLSYRAQLKGWQFYFAEEVGVPGELPIIMPAIKSQQYRWNKGGAETARKLVRPVLASSLPWSNKLHAFFHLFNSSVFVALLVAAVLSVPVLFVQAHNPQLKKILWVGVFFLFGFFSIAWFYWTATQRFYPVPTRRFVRLFPGFLIVSMGLSWHNALAVVEGWLGRKTPFVRTPKFNVVNAHDSWRGNAYASWRRAPGAWLEWVLTVYFLAGCVCAFWLQEYGLLFFHVLLTLGFGTVAWLSFKHATRA